jgi:hypothetical protein
MTVTLGRREIVAALGGASVWPLAARAQQRALPVIGQLGSTAEADVNRLRAFLQGLGEAGFTEAAALKAETSSGLADSAALSATAAANVPITTGAKARLDLPYARKAAVRFGIIRLPVPFLSVGNVAHPLSIARQSS